MILLAFLISGGLAGLAGVCEVAGPIGMLRISVSPGYGFTAIIVAFLGRLNPFGILIAGFVLALTFLGGEGAQISLGLPEQMTRVFQGLLLFYVLACDTFILYRPRWHATGDGESRRGVAWLRASSSPSSPRRRRCSSRRSASSWRSAPACSISASKG